MCIQFSFQLTFCYKFLTNLAVISNMRTSAAYKHGFRNSKYDVFTPTLLRFHVHSDGFCKLQTNTQTEYLQEMFG